MESAPLDERLSSAADAVELGEFRRARDLCSFFEPGSPGYGFSRGVLAQVALRVGLPDKARSLLACAISQEPLNPWLRYSLAEALSLLGEESSAVQNLVMADELCPEWTAPKEALAHLLVDPTNAQLELLIPARLNGDPYLTKCRHQAARERSAHLSLDEQVRRVTSVPPAAMAQDTKRNLRVYKRFLAPDDCRSIVAMLLRLRSTPGRVGGGVYRPDVRRSDVARLSFQQISESDVLNSVLIAAAQALPVASELSIDGVQIAAYSASDLGEFDWHRDDDIMDAPNSRRAVSFSLSLSEPGTYSGGTLEIEAQHGRILKAPSAIGDLSVFRSFVPHRVTPVTRGVRHSLSGWLKLRTR
jgi:PKHD-type hydroxylase